MRYRYHRLKRYIAFVSMALAFSFSKNVTAERYFTWVDETGRVQHSLIVEEPNPLIRDEKDSSRVENGSKNTNADSTVSDVQKNENTSDKKSDVEGFANPKKGGNTNSTRSATAEGEKSAVDITDINEKDFIDGDELEGNNFVRPGESSRYYTWVDAEGRIVNSLYDGKTVTELVSPSALIDKTNIKSGLSTYDQIPGNRLPDSANIEAKAAAIFGLAPVELNSTQLAEYLGADCCLDFDFEFISELSEGSEILIVINKLSKKHNFSSGKSAYELVKMASSTSDYLMRFRTFISSDVFLPTFVYLDENFQVVRVLKNISVNYTPENWFRYAYFEGLVDVKYVSSGEKYLLIITTREDLKSSTLVMSDNERGVKVVHGEYGSIELFTIH